MRHLERVDDGCTKSPCSVVVINYPQFAPGPALHGQINALIQKELSTILSDNIMEADGNESTEDLTRMFLQGYQEFKANFPESKTPWYLKLDVVVGRTDRSFISLSINHSSYTGGAHPNSTISYLNVSSEGKLITELDFFVNSEAKLKDLAQKEFRKKYELAADQKLSDKGFLFENDEFQLSENYGFTSSGMIFYYNPYEIASYAEGPIALLIPYSDMAGIYKHKAP